MSQGAAAILRHHGIQAETLAGGNQAWHASLRCTIPLVQRCRSGNS
jgi:hypothetical protein